MNTNGTANQIIAANLAAEIALSDNETIMEIAARPSTRTSDLVRNSLSDYIDGMIQVLQDGGYTYDSAFTGFGTVSDDNRYGINGHTNGNYYTMVCPYPVANPVIYIARDTSRVSV